MSHRVPRALFIAFSCAAALLPSSVWAQNAQRSASSQQRLYLVFPFENNGSSPRFDWLGEGLEELTIQYLSDAGEQVYSHAGRASELERYGLPTSAKLSRATMLRIAQDLDADYVIFGSFNSDGTNLTVNSHVLRVDPPALTAPVSETGPLSSLMDMQAKVVWHTLVANDKSYPLALAEFSKSLRPLRLDAFEHFVRGVLATDDEPRLRELREAARLDPNWPDPAFALGFRSGPPRNSQQSRSRPRTRRQDFRCPRRFQARRRTRPRRRRLPFQPRLARVSRQRFQCGRRFVPRSCPARA